MSTTNNESENYDDQYFAASPSDHCSSILKSKAAAWYDGLRQNLYLDKVRRSYDAYHGNYYSEAGTGHEITLGGEQGELVNFPVNHYRNIASHIIRMITSTRPAFKAQSTNGDYRSIVQTELANGLLNYYMREKRMEKYLYRAVEYAVVLGSGFIKMEWNATTGEIYDYDEDLDMPIHNGDVNFTNLSPFDVVFDSSKDTSEMDWVLIRSYKNKYDLAAKYPEHADELKKLRTKSDMTQYRLLSASFDQTEDIPVYEFYHERTESLPEGRYMLFVDNDLVLEDFPMPYDSIPVYRLSVSDILGTAYGYTSLFDLLPLQDALNSLYSIVLTNQTTLGVQNIYVPRGADISLTQLVGSMNIIEGNAAAGEPKPLQLTSTPAEIFNTIPMIIKDMETISGINSVSRGNPEASLKSGTALALIQSQSIQFMSGLQKSYVHMMEDIATGLINLLKTFAEAPRVANIVGKSYKSKMDEFTRDNLSSVNRVLVEVVNPLSQTTAGRLEIAQSLLQMYGDKLPIEQYIQVLNTGDLNALTEGTSNELDTAVAENERLADGNAPVMAIGIDDHYIHMREHKKLISDPELRFDHELRERVMNHIREHTELLRTTDPGLLQGLGIQPLEPVQPDMGGQDPGAAIDNPGAQDSSVQMPKLPEPAKPAGEGEMPLKPDDIPPQG